MIDWIDSKLRVPDNRRKVLAWGSYNGLISSKPHFMGETRYNMSKDGGSFDIERVGYFPSTVTHWAEIEGPAT